MDATLAKMAIQSTIYLIWRERNGRRHNQPLHSPLQLAYTVHKEIEIRLLSRRREGTKETTTEDGHSRWVEITRLST
ncbi:unnamed protein product [Arabis nemorensis]|uniref:Uncharacterized protein n=1 Tax=Arabis nemorensis TaxID=586526 RepID=A0A565B0H7_9BRAS|nr:unnamed protein product [Arabis nemorensis]